MVDRKKLDEMNKAYTEKLREKWRLKDRIEKLKKLLKK